MFACIHAPSNLPLLLECAGYFSPQIEETSPDTVVFDIRGLRLIFGTPQEIAGEIQRRLGLPANLAIASNPDAAVHAARGIPGVTVIPPGREAAVLAKLPLFLLGGTPEFAATLDTWGIRTFGELAALPPIGIAARLGDQGVAMQRLARGEGQRLLRIRGEALDCSEEMEPESPIELQEPLLLIVAQMLGRLCDRLGSQGLSASEVHLRLKLERALELTGDHEIVLRLPVPMLDTKVFLKLLQLDLSGRPPQAAVEKIRLQLKPAEPRTHQQGLFLPTSPQPEKLEITLARIRNLVGASNAGTPEVLDTYRPDSFRLGALALARIKSPAPSALSFVLRRFRPPAPAQVACDPTGQPLRVSCSKAEGRILVCSGPWRSSGDWWTNQAWAREDWDVEISTGALLRICRHGHPPRWFVEGSYD